MLCGSKPFENAFVYLARFLALQYAKQLVDYCRHNLGQHLALVSDTSCELGLHNFMELYKK
jgi:hypothetical protein